MLDRVFNLKVGLKSNYRFRTLNFNFGRDFLDAVWSKIDVTITQVLEIHRVGDS